MKTIEQRRKTDRERLKRWRQNKLAAGNKQIQLMLTPEARAILTREKKRTGEPFVSIINRAIVGLAAASPEAPAKTETGTAPEQKTVRDLIIEMGREGRDEWQIAEALNARCVPTLDDKREWYPSTVRGFLSSGQRQNQ